MRSGEIRAVLLDLDDTLTDRRATLAVYAQRFLRDFGDRFRADDLSGLTAELVRIDRNGYNFDRASDLKAHDAWTTSPSVDVLAAHWDHHFVACTQGRPGLMSTVDALARAGVGLGVITNGPTAKQRRKLEVLRLLDCLGAVLISEDFGAAKPDPRIFHAAAQRLGVEPGACMFVGDNPEKDVHGAAAAGMRAVWFRAAVPWPEGLPKPQESVASLAELLQLPDLPTFEPRAPQNA